MAGISRFRASRAQDSIYIYICVYILYTYVYSYEYIYTHIIYIGLSLEGLQLTVLGVGPCFPTPALLCQHVSGALVLQASVTLPESCRELGPKPSELTNL